MGKSLATVFAPEWLVSSMDPHVFLKKILWSSRGSKSLSLTFVIVWLLPYSPTAFDTPLRKGGPVKRLSAFFILLSAIVLKEPI